MTPSARVVFFGSGPVALATIQGLELAGFQFEAIITKPRPVHHHGPVPVLDYAETHHLPLFTPATKDELTTLFAQHKFTSRVGLVVDYGIIISRPVIDSFELGIINSHFSLLPQWRGADPITFAILSGQTETGVSLMHIVEKLDEGNLIAQQTYQLSPAITIQQLTHDLVTLSNDMIIRHLPRYLAGQIEPYPQPAIPATYSRKLTKDDCQIDPTTKPAIQLEREVRAFLGWPKSRLTIGDTTVIITKSHVLSDDTAAENTLTIDCANNSRLVIDELIGPSGKTMSGEAFLRGYGDRI